MTLYLTSSPTGSYREAKQPSYKGFNPENRLVDNLKEPKKVEMALWKIIPAEEGSDFCHRLVFHGREVCTARTKPYCDKCCLKDICGKNGVE